MKQRFLRPGMTVKIIGDNNGRPGGRITSINPIGRVVKLSHFIDYHGFMNGDQNHEGENVDGIWRTDLIVNGRFNLGFHPSQFIVIRDEKGRFCSNKDPDEPNNAQEGPLKARRAPRKAKEVVPQPVAVPKAPEPVKQLDVRRHFKDKDAGTAASSYGILFKDGTERQAVNAGCHASFYPTKDGAIQAATYIRKLGWEEKRPKDYKAVQEWFEYLSTESMFKDIILTKDWEEAWNVGINLDVNAPRTHVIAAAVVLRQLCEWHNWAPQFWNYLKDDLKLSSHEAFYMVGAFQAVPIGVGKFGKLNNRLGGAHGMFMPCSLNGMRESFQNPKLLDPVLVNLVPFNTMGSGFCVGYCIIERDKDCSFGKDLQKLGIGKETSNAWGEKWFEHTAADIPAIIAALKQKEAA